MPPTAFVSHYHCSLHDPGWKHPDHQGRLPALVRAVYRDMLTLHGRLLEVEGRPATAAELERVHTPAYLHTVRAAAMQAEATGAVQRLGLGAPVSAASWDATVAAAGVAIRGVEVVLAGEAANAFCATRPPGRGAAADAAGEFALLNNAAVAARAALLHPAIQRVLVLDTAAAPAGAAAAIFDADPAVCAATVHGVPTAESADGIHTSTVAGSAGVDEVRMATANVLDSVTAAGFLPDLVLWSVSFDMLHADPAGSLDLHPADYHLLTRDVCAFAEHTCGGRLVTLLEYGWAAPETGAAVVQHLRALAGLAAA